MSLIEKLINEMGISPCNDVELQELELNETNSDEVLAYE